MEGLTISRVAEKANVNIETVRYYEKQGLLVQPPRTQSGYRIFSNGTVERIRFIKRAQELGFTLSEVKILINICDGRESDCGDVKSFAHKKIAEINLKIRDLERIKTELEDLYEQCPGEGPVDKCPILKRFQERIFPDYPSNIE